MLLRRYLTLTLALVASAGLFGCGGANKGVTTEPETPAATEPTVQFGELAKVESGPTQLTFDDCNNGLGSYHPAGDRIAFQSDRDGRWQIYELNLNDNSTRALVTSQANDENPVWIPDSSGVLFVSDRNGGGNEFARDILVHYTADDATAVLTDDPADDWFPTPIDASSFLFVSERGVTEGTADIDAKNSLYIGSLNGATPVLVPTPNLDPSSPASLGEGKYLARASNGQLDIISSADGVTESVTPESFHCGTVSYNSNRALAAVTAKDGDVYGLYLFNPSTKLFQKLDTGDGEVRYPQFSSDGNKILFSKEVNSKFQIFELHLAQ